MTTHEKTPAGATNTDQGNEILRTGISTNNDTRTSQGTRKPKRRTWHIRTGYTDDGRATGLCGWVSKPAPMHSPRGAKLTDDGLAPVKCPMCDEILTMQQAAVERQQRALRLAQHLLDHIDGRK